MLIIDVMRRLNTGHEIAFLLTAYVETLQFYDAAKRLPPGVAVLPLRDEEDIEARFQELLGAGLCGLARSHCDTQSAIAREATEIFGVACMRLQMLRKSGAVPATNIVPQVSFAVA